MARWRRLSEAAEWNGSDVLSPVLPPNSLFGKTTRFRNDNSQLADRASWMQMMLWDRTQSEETLPITSEAHVTNSIDFWCHTVRCDSVVRRAAI
jgi:hypothetical protein